MSHTNTTTNYGLPQFLSSDKPAWMADINVAFADIDTQMKLNADAAADAQSDVNDASLNFAAGYSNASTYDVGDVVVYNNRMYICDVAVTVPESFDIAKWTYYRVSNTADAVENLTSAENALESLVGSTDISAIGDGTVTGAIDTINTNLSDLSGVGATLATVTQSATVSNLSTLNNYRYLAILGTASDFIYVSGIIPIHQAKQLKSVSPKWHFETYDGSRNMVNINFSDIDNNNITTTFSGAITGVYVVGLP